MRKCVCPPWVGYLLISPLRRFLENPVKILGPYVKDGMVVLEPGCGMGYFTLDLARMVGPKGRVVAVEIQEKMLSVLAKRAKRAGLMERIDLRFAGKDGIELKDLRGKVDFIPAIHMVHELSDKESFFSQMSESLKSGGRLLFLELRGHVPRGEFDKSLTIAENSGLRPEAGKSGLGGHAAVLIKK